jgi:hypothetical protein
MKKTADKWLLFIIIIFSACQDKVQYNPEKYLSPEAQQQFLYKISRYTAKLPKRVSHQEKFNAKYDHYFREEIKKYRVQQYYIAADSTHYFLINRPAPSLYQKWVAIGGRLRYDQSGNIAAYEEVFRTWKMKEDDLNKKGYTLFETLIETGNVTAYLPDKTEDEWVEFPDARNYFDTASRRWKMYGQEDSAVYYIN